MKVVNDRYTSTSVIYCNLLLLVVAEIAAITSYNVSSPISPLTQFTWKLHPHTLMPS